MSSLNDAAPADLTMAISGQTISNTRSVDTFNNRIPIVSRSSISFRDSVFNALGRFGHNYRGNILIGTFYIFKIYIEHWFIVLRAEN